MTDLNGFNNMGYCLSPEMWNRFPFLRANFPKQEDKPYECLKNGALVMDGPLYDGMVEITSFVTGKTSLLRDDGAVFHGLSSMEKEKLYLDPTFKRPTLFIPAEEARGFIVEMMGVNALSGKAETTYCVNHGCGANPIVYSDSPPYTPIHPTFYAKRGRPDITEKLLKERLGAEDPFQKAQTLNQLALFYTEADDPKYRRLDEATRLAHEAIKVYEATIKQGTIEAEGRSKKPYSYYHTLAVAYYRAANYQKALEWVGRIKGEGDAGADALKEMIAEAMKTKKPEHK